MFYIAGDILRYRLYTAMCLYSDLNGAMAALNDSGNIDFKPVINDIFGDG